MSSILDQAKKYAQDTGQRKSVYELVSIWLHEDPEVICLLEVNESSITHGEVAHYKPIGMGIDYWCHLIVVSPDEWAKVQSGETTLPHGWNKDALQCLYQRANDAKKLATFPWVQKYAQIAMEQGATKEELVSLIQEL